MDTKCVDLFVRAAETLNISAAGKTLGLRPSVASAWLSKLENDLGITLFYRTTRKVSLTLEGEEFLPFAHEILAQESAARVALGQEDEMVKGTLRFAASSTFAQSYIMPILPKFFQTQPKLTLDMKLSDKPFDLIEGSFDLALRNMALSDSTFKARKLADDHRILCAAPDYLKLHGVPNVIKDLAHHDLIAFGNLGALPLRSSEATTEMYEPRKDQIRLIIDDGHSQKIAAMSGLGICQCALWTVSEEIQNGQLVRVLPEFQVANDTALWLVYPNTNVVSAKVRVFMDFLIDNIGRNPPWLNDCS
jgi:DNA-binding transcriptional LysR family regulator